MNFNGRSAVVRALALFVPGAEVPFDGMFEVVSEVVVRGRRGRLRQCSGALF
mgnify:CR=1 FL=1